MSDYLLLLYLLQDVGENGGDLHVGETRLDLVGVREKPNAVANLRQTQPKKSRID